MEKYENIVKIEEIRRMMENKRYDAAMKLLDTMDYSRIKSLTDLSIIADVLAQNEYYEDAMEVLMRIHTKTKTRRVLYQLVDVSIKRKVVEEAEEFLLKYINAAPRDSYRYIFRYRIDKLLGEPYDILIESLEQLKEYEYIENWAYELAKLYHKAGLKDKCIRECSDIILWFGEGLYVEKAKLLKGYYVGEINPLHMLKAKEKKETEEKLGLYKTKDYSSMRTEIDRYLESEEEKKNAEEEKKNAEEEYAALGLIHHTYKEDAQTNGQAVKEFQEKTDNSKHSNAFEEEDLSTNENNEPVLEDFYEIEKNLIFDIADNIYGAVEEGIEEQPEAHPLVMDEDAPILEGAVSLEVTETTNAIIDEYMDSDEMLSTAEIYEEIVEVFDQETQEKMEGASLQESLQETEEEYLQEPLQELEGASTQESQQELDEVSNKTSEDMINEINPLAQLSLETSIDFEKIYGYFSYIPVCSSQIVNCLENLQKVNTKQIHMVIAGERKSGKTTLAKKMCKALHALSYIQTPRVAKISADKLNQINLEEKSDKLVDGALIIERAGLLENSTVERLLHFMKKYEGHILVILEDRTSNLENLFITYPKLSEAFDNILQLPNYTKEDLYGFAECYVIENDYQLTMKAEGFLRGCINGLMERQDLESVLEDLMEIMKKAIKTANERNQQALYNIIGKGNLNSTDLLLIDASDFQIKEV